MVGRFRRTLATLLLGTLALVSGGCDQPALAPEQPARTEALSATVRSPALTDLTFDDRLVAVEAEVPGFGGVFVDERGVVHAWVVADLVKRTDPSAVRAALNEQFGPEAVPRGAPLQLQAGRYTVAQLHAWHHRAKSLLGTPDVVLTDLDEAANRIFVGVSRVEAVPDVRDRAVRAGIPVEALVVDLEAHATLAASLQGDLLPALGGVEVRIGDYGVFGEPEGTCTMGFMAWRDGRPGFVVNAHCTVKRFGPDKSEFSQYPGPVGVVGWEATDPSLQPCAYSPPWRCRQSDAAFGFADPDLPSKPEWGFGRIARTTSIGVFGLPGSLTIDPKRGPYEIDQALLGPFVGSMLHKVGRTTGHTAGFVKRTCVDEFVIVPPDVWVMECQGQVHKAGVGPGDSGSPVFRLKSSGRVALAGILWGSIPGPGFRFSYLDRTMAELGAFTVF